MTQVVRIFSVPNPLRKCLGRTAGITLDEAVRQAKANIETDREKALAEIDQWLQQVHRLAASMGEGTDRAARDEIYRLSNAIANLAGVFELGPLHKAAYSLCELIDRLDVLQRACPSAVAVHVEGMRALRHVDPVRQQAAAHAILAGLAKVLVHVDSAAGASAKPFGDVPPQT
jgi:hypothetical protein